jgi:hypothetical protein
VKRRFSVRRISPKHGRPGPGSDTEVDVRGFDPRGYLVRESTAVSRMTGSDGPATRAEAQRYADWLNYAEECFYAGLPVSPHVGEPTQVVEVDLPEVERRLAAASGLVRYLAGSDQGH